MMGDKTMNTKPMNNDTCKPTSADSLKLVVMLYDGAIGFLNQAVRYADRQDDRQKNSYLQRANDIIVELDKSLDVEAGGEIAKNLKLLYSFMNRQLIDAAINNTVSGVSDVARMLAELRESWQYVDESMRAAA